MSNLWSSSQPIEQVLLYTLRWTSQMRATRVVFLLAFVMPFLVLAQDNSGAPAPMFKGMELYSWRDTSGTWCYSLLNGTNRTKILAEIQNPRAVTPGVVELKKRLASLPEREQVFWWSSRPPLTELSYPAQEIVDDLVKFAAEHNIALHIDR